MAHLKCNLRLKEGARHLLLGRNGCGKTTLLRALASGTLDGFPRDLRVQLVGQDAYVDLESSALEVVFASDTALLALQSEATNLEHVCDSHEDADKIEAAGLRLCEIFDAIEELDDGQRRRRARKILTGLGFADDKMDVPLHKLSGGWRMRAILAAALFMEPGLLLLDEPTNHLDLDAITWLQRHLADEFPGTVLCVSHDRAFVNAVANEIVVFTDNHSLEYFSGNLDDLYKQAAKMARRNDRQDTARQKKVDLIEKQKEKLEVQFDKREINLTANKDNKKYGNYQGTGVTNIDKASAQVKKGVKKLERLELEAHEEIDGSWAAALVQKLQNEDSEALKFAFKEAEPLNLPRDTPMLEMSGVGFRYPDGKEDVLTDVHVSIMENSRIAIAGKNGAGKSTLMKLLTGSLTPSSGEVTQNGNLRIAEFGQHDAENLQRHTMTPHQYMEERFPKMPEPAICEQLLAFGVTDEMMQLPMAELSGGQRMRVAFSGMCAEEPHLLVLDEPTNHLDIYAIEALTDALREFKGAVIFVTHNRHLIEAVADNAIVVGGSRTRLEMASQRDKKRFNNLDN